MTRRRVEDETCVAGRRFRLTEVARGRMSLGGLRQEWPRPPRKWLWQRRPLGRWRAGRYR